MTIKHYSYEDFETTRKRLVRETNALLQDSDRALLLSMKNGDPQWDLFPVAALKNMPAVKWKLANIQKLKSQNPAKHAEQLRALENVLTQ